MSEHKSYMTPRLARYTMVNDGEEFGDYKGNRVGSPWLCVHGIIEWFNHEPKKGTTVQMEVRVNPKGLWSITDTSCGGIADCKIYNEEHKMHIDTYSAFWRWAWQSTGGEDGTRFDLWLLEDDGVDDELPNPSASQVTL